MGYFTLVLFFARPFSVGSYVFEFLCASAIGKNAVDLLCGFIYLYSLYRSHNFTLDVKRRFAWFFFISCACVVFLLVRHVQVGSELGLRVISKFLYTA